MSAEQVALIPQCAECGEVWLPADDDRWRAYLDTDDDLVFYCPTAPNGNSTDSGEGPDSRETREFPPGGSERLGIVTPCGC
jgi:hypothetical protein